MNRSRRVTTLLVGVAFVVFGFLCLNYTKGFDMDHHVAWATERGFPKPAYSIFVAGAILEAIGGGLIGRSIGRSGKGAA